jgi:hypothetical protein
VLRNYLFYYTTVCMNPVTRNPLKYN